MANIIDFKQKQEKDKEVVESILKKGGKVFEYEAPIVPPFLDNYWGMLEPIVLSTWKKCSGCGTTFKYSIPIRNFIETMTKCIQWIDIKSQNPLHFNECSACGHISGFSIKNLSFESYDHQEDGTPWPLPDNEPLD